MSAKGILTVAGVLTRMQNVTQELFHLGGQAPDTPQGQQDIRLARLLEEAKDLIQQRFAEETLLPAADSNG